MSKPYCTDIVPVLSSFMGVDAAARNLSGLIVRFTGYVISDWEYAKFRAQVMTLVNKHMSDGRGGVDIIRGWLSPSFVYNETYALWLVDDLENWGYSCHPWFITCGRNSILLEDGDTFCFLTVDWKLPKRARPFCLCLPDSDDESD